jgi:hypothetical protein
VNFDQLVNTILEDKKDEWVLFIKQDLVVDDDDPADVIIQLKPVGYITDEEKDAIKNKMRRAHSYMNGYEGNDVIGYDEVTVIFGPKKELEKEIEEIKDVYYNVKQEVALEPELQPHWGGIVDEL